MALLKLGSLITSISGKIGGQTIMNGAQGFVLKNIGNTKKTATPSQSAQRQATATISRLWRELTPANRATFFNQVGNWTYTNRVGEVRGYTAFQIFMKLNQGAQIIGTDPVYNADSPKLISFPSFTVTSVLVSNLEITATGTADGEIYVLYCSSYLSPGISNATAYLKKVAVITKEALDLGFDFTDAYIKIFGTIQPGQRIAFTLQSFISADGQSNFRPAAQFFTTV